MSGNFINKLPKSKVEKNYSLQNYEEAQKDTLEINKDVLTPKEKRYERETDLRENLSIAFTIIISLWLLAVFLLLVGNTNHYRLSNSVLNTLLVTTTANVIGMMIIILKNLFPNRDNKGE